MKIEQIYTGCLSHGAYYIESDGEVAIIDPLREVAPYMERAARDKAVIKYVFETHFHADFVSGHIDLAQKTGAEIIYGPTANPGFKATVGEDGQVFKLGRAGLVLLHTPGHTMESCCILLRDEHGKDKALFTGDTLFIGDVGRPDLAQKAANKTQEELAGILYDSLRSKVLPLADDVIIYPGHGEGSACGKQLSKERNDTLGHQRQTNYALANISREDFVRQVLEGLTPPPAYFPTNVTMNKSGYEYFDTIMSRALKPLLPDAFERMTQEHDALVLDTRNSTDFCSGFIPGAINIGLEGQFAPWVGALVKDVKQPILLVTEKGKETEAVTRLARIGFDNCMGYLSGGMEAWTYSWKKLDRIPVISAEILHRSVKSDAANLLDVRRPQEYNAGHIAGSINLPLNDINERMQELDKNSLYYVYCASGYRSVIFISILKARGYEKLINVSDGFRGMQSGGLYHIQAHHMPA